MALRESRLKTAEQLKFMSLLQKLNERVSAARADVEARGETSYPGASRIHLATLAAG